jgi:hypothetical protein
MASAGNYNAACHYSCAGPAPGADRLFTPVVINDLHGFEDVVKRIPEGMLLFAVLSLQWEV